MLLDILAVTFLVFLVGSILVLLGFTIAENWPEAGYAIGYIVLGAGLTITFVWALERIFG